MNTKYDLMFGSLGNGTTVFNRAREEYGDYATLAHIDDCGAVIWYVNTKKLPPYVLEDVNKRAAAQARNFKHGFMHLPKSAALDMLRDMLNIGQFLIEFQDGKIHEKSMEEIYQAYIKYVCKNGRRMMPEV